MNRLLAACALALPPAFAQGATLNNFYSNTVVFGDSLSDNGTFGVQATDTDVWAGQLGITTASGRNFAALGARAIPNAVQSDFLEQIATFDAAMPSLPEFSQAVVWFGGNDLLNITNPAVEIPLAISVITSGIINLAQNYGIDRVVIPGLPDFSQIPAALGDPSAQAASLAFNNGLISTTALLNSLGIDARYVDIAGLVNDARSNPDFTNTTDTCLRGAISCDGFLFWDPIHPTGQAHALVAEAIAAELAPVPLPAGGVLILTGLFALGVVRTRKSATV